MRERLLVVEVEARDQPLDRLAADAEGPVAHRARPRQPRSAAGRNTRCSASSSSAASAAAGCGASTGTRRSSSAPARRGRRASRSTSPARARRRPAARATRRRPAPPPPGGRGRPSTARARAAARRAAGRGRRARARSSRSWPADRSRRAARGRARGRAAACARRARGSRGRARRPSLAPSISPGMSASTSWRSSASSVPSTGLERRERVVGDLRRRARQAREQRRLARVGQPDEPDVGEQLELQLDPALVARAARARRSCGAWRVAVAKRLLPRPPWPPRASTTRAARAPRGRTRVPSQSTHLRPRRDAHDEVVAVGAVAQRALTVAGRARPCSAPCA